VSGPRNGARIDRRIDRLDQLEAIEQIRQLASRYALALDSRDLDTLVELYVDDVRVTRTERGRDAMRAVFDDALRTFRTSVHFVAEHVIELDDGTAADRSPERATGVVYCRAEHEVGDQWVVVPLQYVDDYERRDDQWYFRRRKILVWYETDVLTRPASALAQRRQWPGRAPAAGDLPTA
jgi:ketosteroid isomerase-like protein